MGSRRWKGGPYHARTMIGVFRRRRAALAGLLLAAVPGAALGHGSNAPPPDMVTVVGLWVLDPLPIVLLIVSALAYLLAARMVDRAHPRAPVSRWRTACWLAGLAVIGVALLSAIDVYAEELLSVHLVQHLLLGLVAPPLLALGMPVTLALRASSPGVRRGILLPILHSRVVRVLASPLVAWPLFVIGLWATHFTPLYDAALEDPVIHVGEHLVFIITGVLFWWPVIGADPLPHRMAAGWRALYLLAVMPFCTAIGLIIYFAPTVLYAHYATNLRTWGPSPLTDQQLGGLLMWGVGDLIILAAITWVIASWMGTEAQRELRA